MPNWMNIVIGTAGVVGGAILTHKLLTYKRSMKDMEKELQSIVTVNVHSLTLAGLTIRVDIKLQNPTSGTMKLKFPYINILYKGSMLGSSEVINQDVILPPYGEAVFNGIMVNVPVLGLVTFGSAIVDLLLKKENVEITVDVLIPVDLGWKRYNYKKSYPFTLKAPTYGG